MTIDSPNCPSMKVARAVTDLFSSEDEKYWILSGAHVHNGGHEEPYGLNMHSLSVNDKVGVQIRPNGNLHFYKNGFDKGVAMKNLPMKKDIYAVFDVYGRTKQVSWDYFGGKDAFVCKIPESHQFPVWNHYSGISHIRNHFLRN